MLNKTLLLLAVFGKPTEYQPPDDKLKEVFSTLCKSEVFVLEKRYGNPPMTLSGVGKIYPRYLGGIGVQKERIRQIEAKVLRKLRHSSRARLLWPGGGPINRGEFRVNWCYIHSQRR